MSSHEDTKRAANEELELIAASEADCGFQIHRELGPGLLVQIRYRGALIENAFKIDLLVEDRLVVEPKSLDRLLPVHGKQVLTYLRLMDLPLGLLMNFGEALFKNGLRRIVNDYAGPFPSR